MGVGLGFLILLLGAGAFFLYHRRSKARKNTQPYPDQPAPGYIEKPGYPMPSNYYPTQIEKQHYPMAAAPSELSPGGHEYNELGTDRTNAGRSARVPHISELASY